VLLLSNDVLRFYFSEFKWSEFSASMKTSIIIFSILFLFFIIMGFKFKKLDKENAEVPTKGLAFLCVIIVETINNHVDSNFGKNNRKIFAPWFLGIASFISIANIASLFGLNPPFGNLGVALSLSVLAFMIFQFTGLKFQGIKERIKGFLGPVKAFSPIIFPISIIGEFTTPFSMGMRMFGNIFSGIIIAGLVFIVGEALGGLIGSIAVTAAITTIIHPIFDVFFGLLQMYVYFMLTTMFVKQNM